MTHRHDNRLVRTTLQRTWGVHPSESWLQACATARQHTHHHDEEWTSAVVQQILHADLRDVVRTPLTATTSTVHNNNNNESDAAWRQLRRAIRQSHTATSDASSGQPGASATTVLPESFRLLVQIEECADMSTKRDSRYGGDAVGGGTAAMALSTRPQQQQQQARATKRCLKLCYSDGHPGNTTTSSTNGNVVNQTATPTPSSSFVAMELATIPGLPHAFDHPGVKVLLTGPVTIRHGVAGWDPTNALVLGGTVPQWHTWHADALATARLGATVQTDPTLRALINPESFLEDDQTNEDGRDGPSTNERAAVAPVVRPPPVVVSRPHSQTRPQPRPLVVGSSSTMASDRRSPQPQQALVRQGNPYGSTTTTTPANPYQTATTTRSLNGAAAPRSISTSSHHPTRTGTVVARHTSNPYQFVGDGSSSGLSQSTSTTTSSVALSPTVPSSMAAVAAAAPPRATSSNPYRSTGGRTAGVNQPTFLPGPANAYHTDGPPPATTMRQPTAAQPYNNNNPSTVTTQQQRRTTAPVHPPPPPPLSLPSTTTSTTAMPVQCSFAQLTDWIQRALADVAFYRHLFGKVYVVQLVQVGMHSHFNIEKVKVAKEKKKKGDKQYGWVMVARYRGGDTDDGNGLLTCKMSNAILEPHFPMPPADMKKLSRQDKPKSDALVSAGGKSIKQTMSQLRWYEVTLLRPPDEVFQSGQAALCRDGDKPVLCALRQRT